MARNYLRNLFTLVCVTCVASQFGGPQPGQLNCGDKADIVFLLDKSGSVGDKIVQLRNFAKHWADKLNLDEGTKYRAGIVSYATNPTKIQDTWATRVSELDEMSVTAFEANLNTIEYDPAASLTNIEAGLEKAYAMLTDTSRGARENVPKFLVFTNEGRQTWPLHSWNPNSQVIQDLHDHDDITVFSIEIEEQHGEANAVASDPKAENYIFVQQYAELNNAVMTHDKIEAAMCKVFNNPNDYLIEIEEANACAPVEEVVYQMAGADLQGAISPVVTFNNVNNVPFAISAQGQVTKNGEYTQDSYEFNAYVEDSTDASFSKLVTFRVTFAKKIICKEDYFWKESYCPKAEWNAEIYDSKIDELTAKKSQWNCCKATTRSYIADCENRPYELDDLLDTFCQCGALVSEACKMIESLEEAKKNI